MSRLCTISECNQPIADKQTKLCHKHHLRKLRYGTTELTRKLVDKSQECKYKECNRKQQTIKGLCLMHYKQWKRKQPNTKKCKVCDKEAGDSMGMCAKHYQQFKRNGNPLHAEIRKCMPYGNGQKYLQDFDGKWTHRRVAEESIGRKLKHKEVVHHINLDKLDNSAGNLLVLSNSKHLSLHRQLESVAGELLRHGLIEFKNGKYSRCI